MSYEYDDLTPSEKAKIDVERNAYDLRATIESLNALRLDPLSRDFVGAESNNLNGSLARLQLLCSEIALPALKVVGGRDAR